MQLVGVDIEHHVLEVQDLCGGSSSFNDGYHFDILSDKGGVICVFHSRLVMIHLGGGGTRGGGPKQDISWVKDREMKFACNHA